MTIRLDPLPLGVVTVLAAGEAYMVVPAADFTALRDTTWSKSEGSRVTSLPSRARKVLSIAPQSGRLGESGPLPPEVQPYAGDQVTVKVYGSGPLADVVCDQLQQQGF